jgi:hypothetical protein
MGPSDFNISGAEAALEAKLQKYNSSPRDLNRYHPAPQAECDDIFGLILIPLYREANLETGLSIWLGGNYVGFPRAKSMT